MAKRRRPAQVHDAFDAGGGRRADKSLRGATLEVAEVCAAGPHAVHEVVGDPNARERCRKCFRTKEVTGPPLHVRAVAR
jgi:hypothetical protein